MCTRWFGKPGRGSGIVRNVTIALGMGAVILFFVDGVSGQAQRSQGSATAPKAWTPERLPDGQPNVQGGIWRTPGGGTSYLFGDPVRKLPSRIVDPPDGRVPYLPWAFARWKQQEKDLENPTKPEHIDTQARCLSGPPRLYYYVSNYTILQPPGMVVFLWEIYHMYRVIPVDGSPHVGSNIKMWMGDGRGRWEGNTLVVDTTNLNGKNRLTSTGDFFTDKVHLSERFVFVDPDTMNYEVTLTDPSVYTRPWTMRVTQKRPSKKELFDERGQVDVELWEEGCVEGEAVRPSELPAYRGAPNSGR